jgi:hypothetical protein
MAGHAVAGLSAYAKRVSLGIVEPKLDLVRKRAPGWRRRAATRRPARPCRACRADAGRAGEVDSELPVLIRRNLSATPPGWKPGALRVV